ncbi:MAG: hypothetical protein ACYDDB_01435 [bacterium]
MSTNALLEPRVDRLEEALIRLAEAQAETQRELADFKKEMSDFKNEMSDFKKEMRDFKEEMSDFKREMRDSNREMNKRWGALANKMGTIVEDIVYPAVRPLIARYFSYDISDIEIAENIIRRRNGIEAEFDIVASTKDKVFLIEVKSTVREKYIEAFLKRKEQFFDFFPEYTGRKLIIIMADISLNDGIVSLLSKNNIYAMAYREWDYMDILNFTAFNI